MKQKTSELIYTPERILDGVKDLARMVPKKDSLNHVQVKDMVNVQEVLQKEGIFSSSKSKYPIIATYGVMSCVAIAGYSNELKRGFLAHIDHLTDRDLINLDDPYWVPKSLGQIVFWGSKDVRGIANYDVSITQCKKSPKLLKSVEDYISFINKWNNDKIHLNVIKRDVEQTNNIGKSIALDLRNGKTYLYSPKENPYARNVDKSEDISRLFPSPLRWYIDDSLKSKTTNKDCKKSKEIK